MNIKLTDRTKQFNEHHEKIAEVIVGCIGVRSREVHWTEVAPMIAAYVQQQLKEERNKAIDEVIRKFSSQWKDQTIAFTAATHYIAYADLLKELESIKSDSK